MTTTRLNRSFYAVLLLSSGLALTGCATVPDDLLSDCCAVDPAIPRNAEVTASAQPTLGTSPPPPVTIADVERVANSTSDETVTYRMVQAPRTISLGTNPKSNSPDSATSAGGGTVFVDYPADPAGETTVRLTLGNTALGITNVTLRPNASEDGFEATLADGRIVSLQLDFVNRNSGAGEAEFSWATYGGWAIRSAANVPTNVSPVVLGVETADAAMPTSGSATFTGFVRGTVTIADGTNLRVANLLGDATIVANFANGTLTGAAPLIMATPLGNIPIAAGTVPGPAQAWNGLNFSGTFATGINGFTGTTSPSSAPGNSYSLASVATGFLGGRFYGPGAEEVAAVWNLADANGVAQGVLVGGR